MLRQMFEALRSPWGRRWLLWLDVDAARLYVKGPGARPSGWTPAASAEGDGSAFPQSASRMLADVFSRAGVRRGETLDAVLAFRPAPGLAVELGEQELPRAVAEALARQRFEQAWGSSDGWRLQMPAHAGRGTVIAFGCTDALHRTVGQGCREAGLRLRSMQPAFAWAERVRLHRLRSMFTEAGAEDRWVVLQEHDRCVGLLDRAQGSAVVMLPAMGAGALADDLVPKLEHWERRLGVSAAPLVVFLGECEEPALVRVEQRDLLSAPLVPLSAASAPASLQQQVVLQG